MKKSWMFLFASLVIVFSFVLLWKMREKKILAQNPSPLRIALDNQVESLDPARAYSDDSLLLSSQVLEPLYQYHYLKRPYEIQPLLAQELPQYLEKGRVLRIKLKKNVLYHSHSTLDKSRTVKAEDFANQFKRMALSSLKSPGRNLFVGLIEGFEQYDQLVNNDWKKIPQVEMSGFKAISEHELEIRLKHPEPNIIYYLALNFVVPLPWELISSSENQLDQVLLGTGPYTFNGVKGNYFELKKFSNYRSDFYPSSGDRYANVENLLDSSKQRIPFIDEIHLFTATQESERWGLFLDNKIDLLTVPKTLIPQLFDNNGDLSPDLKELKVQVKHFPVLANRWLGFNMRHPIVGKNKNLRLAIAYAIDYSKYLQLLSQNTNLRANSILVPGIAGYRPTKEFRFNYNPEKARQHLKLAGFESPDKMPTITYSTRGNQSINILEAEFIKSHLEAIGLKVEIEVLSFSDFLRKGRAGELMFYTDNWIFDYPEGENILQLLVSRNFPGINKSGYQNPRVDELYDNLKKSINPERRDEFIQQIEEIVFEDIPWIPMMYESSFFVHYPWIKNFRKSSLIRNYIKYLKIER
jgi:oligopeptide transport system substrate-binding protein